VPGTENFKRLLLAHAEWRRIAAAEDEDIARAFFIGGNPLLRDGTLITAIREDRAEEVAAAVSKFVEGGGFW
jgi:hypothetical protein